MKPNANPFAGMNKKVESNDRLPHLPADFIGVVAIQGATYVKKRTGGDELYFVNFEIVESNIDDVKVGAHYSWSVKLGNDMGPKNIQQFFCAVKAKDYKDEDVMSSFRDEVPALMFAALPKGDGGQDSLADTLLALRTYNTKTLAGKDFTVHAWTPAD